MEKNKQQPKNITKINERIQTSRTTTNNKVQRLTGLVIAALCLTCTRWLKL